MKSIRELTKILENTKRQARITLWSYGKTINRVQSMKWIDLTGEGNYEVFENGSKKLITTNTKKAVECYENIKWGE